MREAQVKCWLRLPAAARSLPHAQPYRPSRYAGSPRQFATVTQPEWEWALEATVEMNQIHHCLQGRGAEQRSLMHQWWLRRRGASVGALYPGHPSLWKLHWFHHHLALSTGLKWGKFFGKTQQWLKLVWIAAWGAKKLHHLNGNMKHSVAVADLKHAHN